jgi:hypothetical protein
MNGHVFVCFSEQNKRSQYTKTVAMLQEYSNKNLRYPEDLAPLFAEPMRAPAIRGGRHNDSNHGRGRGRIPNACSATREYCWSHDTCAHLGSDCNNPIEGHQAAATFANMLDGSTVGCYWLQP